jgi:hypothetical protein
MPHASTKSLYSVHPSVAYAQAIINNLPAKTGKSLDEWISLIKKSGPKGEKERREWLKKEYKLGGTTTAMIVDRAEGKGLGDTDGEVYLKEAVQFVEAMYSGAKAGLRPLHDALIELGLSLGSDVKICPCQTIVPLYRNHVFAQIKPSTRTRIDFGLALKGAKKIPKRLKDTGGLAKGDRITHCFAITALDDIDEEVKQWLKIAYELDV